MEDWRARLWRDGYARFERIVPPALVQDALEAIREDLERNFEPARELEYGARTWCPDLHGTPAITNLVWRSPFLQILDEAIGVGMIGHDGGQIAIRPAGMQPPPVHIDGFADPEGTNGLEPGRIYSVTALAGLFLTDLSNPFMGNFTVYPGSHRKYEEHFRKRGPQAQQEPMPEVELGEPHQLICEPGDAVLFHYLLAHTFAENRASHDRIAIYFRIWFRDIDEEGRRWHYLTHMWDGWNLGSLQPAA